MYYNNEQLSQETIDNGKALYAKDKLQALEDYAVDELFITGASPRELIYLGKENDLITEEEFELLCWYVDTQM